MEELLEVPEGERHSSVIRFREYPPEATPPRILRALERYDLLGEMGVPGLRLEGIRPQTIRRLAALARRYDAWSLRRFGATKCQALVTRLLIEGMETALDHAIAMHDQYVTGVLRRSRRAWQRAVFDLRERSREDLDRLLDAFDHLLGRQQASGTALSEVLEAHGEATLRRSLASCRVLRDLEEKGYAKEIRNRQPHLTRYFGKFLRLPFAAERGTESLLQAIQAYRDTVPKELVQVPEEVLPAHLRPHLRDGDGHLDHRIVVVALALAIRDALRSGDLYLPGSRHHASFWTLVAGEAGDEVPSPLAHEVLELPSEADALLGELR